MLVERYGATAALLKRRSALFQAPNMDRCLQHEHGHHNAVWTHGCIDAPCCLQYASWCGTYPGTILQPSNQPSRQTVRGHRSAQVAMHAHFCLSHTLLQGTNVWNSFFVGKQRWNMAWLGGWAHQPCRTEQGQRGTLSRLIMLRCCAGFKQQRFAADGRWHRPAGFFGCTSPYLHPCRNVFRGCGWLYDEH